MAEGLFRRATSGRGNFRVLSAGLGAVNDQPATSHSVAAMRELVPVVHGFKRWPTEMDEEQQQKRYVD